jgi:ABC-type Fe3+-hydroxamate transport system substrate-binding protein
LAGSLLRSLANSRGGRRLKAYVEIDLGGPVSFGAHSYIADAFRLLGSGSLFERERVEWLTPDLDAVRALDPDLVVYEPKMFSRFDVGDVGELVRTRGWGGMKAVKSANFFVTPGPLDFLAHHGPSFIREAIPWLGDKLDVAAGRV